MNNLMPNLKQLAVVVLAMTAVELNAKTIALWPIEYDPDNTEYNLRCATNPDYDLTVLKTVTPKTGEDTLDWNLPPNPDTSKFLFTPYNRYSLYTTADGYLQAENVGAMMTVDKPHTLEGFIKITDVGGHGGGTWVIISSVATFANGQIDFRMVPKDGKYYLHFAVGEPTKIDTDFAGPGKTADELKDGKWHHWAYTYQPDNGNGQRVVEAFWDGVSVGEPLSSAAVTTKWTNNGKLMLGSRGLYGNTVKGAIEYVRLSDTILTPEEFLNYGESGTVITTTKSPTVGYWRLGADANGKADFSSQLGNAGFWTAAMANYFSTTSPKVTVEQGKTSLYAVDEGAFTGQPANPTVTLTGGNQGAFYSNGDSNGGMNFDGLGTSLDFSKDWTVETYFRPDTRDTSVTGSRSLFGTMQGKGWVLMTCANQKNSANWARRFRLSATDATNHTEYSHVEILPVMEEWRSEWKHIALVHRAQDEETGFGSWQLYVDGELHATLKDKQAMNDVSPARFSIGTTHNLSGAVWIGGAPGYYDCVRVSATALSPEQFICTKGGTAATAVQALFPLDKNANGTACSYFQDVVGSYTVGELPAEKYRPNVNGEDAPTVTNPDSSEKFTASSATGSVDFKSSGANAAAFCCDEATLSAFNAISGDRSVTIEAYVKHNAGLTRDENILVGSTSALSDSWPAMNIRLSYNSSAGNGFKLSDTTFTTGSFGDVNTEVTMSDGEWHHVAFVATHDETNACWKLYLDGVEKYSKSAALNTKSRGLQMLVVGGRYWGGSLNFNGLISNLRISKGALSPSQFLNAAAPTPETPSTIAYWPLDYKNSLVDMASKVSEGYDFIGTVTGDRDRAYVTNYHASVAAEQERNRGSVAMAGDSRIVSRNVAADYLGLTAPFTLEGCVKSAAQVGEESVICGTYRNGLGWKMIYDATGTTPQVRMYGCGKVPTGSFVNAAFDWDASPLTNGWHQIAIAYDTAGSGTWTLFVDAVKVATVANGWNPKGQGIVQMDLTVGAVDGSGETSFAANYDVWRLSSGVRENSDLLYNPEPLPGMTLWLK